MRSQRPLGILAAFSLICCAVLIVVLLETHALSGFDTGWSNRLQVAGQRSVSLGFGHTEPRWFLATKTAEIGDGETVTGVAVLAASAAALSTRRWRPLLASAATLAVLIAAVEGGKALLGRQSPMTGGSARSHLFGVGGAAFPSGHSAGTLVVFGLVAALFCGPGGIRPSRVGHLVLTLVAASISAVVGVCTVVVAWHWPTDVLGGWLLGAAVLALGSLAVGAGHRAGPVDPGTARTRRRRSTPRTASTPRTGGTAGAAGVVGGGAGERVDAR